MNPNYQPRKFVGPQPEQLPESVRPVAAELIALRESWRDATEELHKARAAAAAAPTAYRQAVTAAAKAGKDPAKITDPRPAADRDLELRTLAERGVADSVVDCWARLWQAVTDNFTDVMAFVDAPAEAATQRLAELERQLDAARHELGQRLAVRQWVAAREVMASGDLLRVQGNGPRPPADVDTGSLARARADETKARGQRQRKADAAAKAAAYRQQRQAEHDAQAAATRARRAARLA